MGIWFMRQPHALGFPAILRQLSAVIRNLAAEQHTSPLLYATASVHHAA